MILTMAELAARENAAAKSMWGEPQPTVAAPKPKKKSARKRISSAVLKRRSKVARYAKDTRKKQSEVAEILGVSVNVIKQDCLHLGIKWNCKRRGLKR